jgi:hypothetical protein
MKSNSENPKSKTFKWVIIVLAEGSRVDLVVV